MQIVEAKGPSLKLSREARRKAELHHLRIYASPDSSPEQPGWLLEHHSSERDRHPGQESFTDGAKMLKAVADASGVAEPAESED